MRIEAYERCKALWKRNQRRKDGKKGSVISCKRFKKKSEESPRITSFHEWTVDFLEQADMKEMTKRLEIVMNLYESMAKSYE